jgi:hypothetical protein
MKLAQTSIYSLPGTTAIRGRSTDFGCLKAVVRRKLMEQFTPVLPVALIKRAVDEAVLTAESTGFPQLFFPVLAEEQVERISRLSASYDADTQPTRLVSAA